MNYGYARCSTDELRQDIERQRRELREAGVEEKNIYWEYERAGNYGRPELAKLMQTIREGDTITATEMSRLTRSTKHLCELLDAIMAKKIKLVVGSFVVDCSGDLSAMTEGMVMMMGIFSQLERKMIIERVKSGLRNAKAKGRQLGRPRLRCDKLPRKFTEAYQLYVDGRISKTDVARLCGVARSTVYRWFAVIQDHM